MGSPTSAAVPALRASTGTPMSEAKALRIASAVGLRQMFAVQTKRILFVSPRLLYMLRLRTPVDVLQADDVVLIELAKGDLEYPDLSFTPRREPVDRPSGYEELLLGFGVEDLSVQLDAGSPVEDDPELVALVVVLARERAAC